MRPLAAAGGGASAGGFIRLTHNKQCAKRAAPAVATPVLLMRYALLVRAASLPHSPEHACTAARNGEPEAPYLQQLTTAGKVVEATARLKDVNEKAKTVEVAPNMYPDVHNPQGIREILLGQGNAAMLVRGDAMCCDPPRWAVCQGKHSLSEAADCAYQKILDEKIRFPSEADIEISRAKLLAAFCDEAAASSAGVDLPALTDLWDESETALALRHRDGRSASVCSTSDMLDFATAYCQRPPSPPSPPPASPPHCITGEVWAKEEARCKPCPPGYKVNTNNTGCEEDPMEEMALDIDRTANNLQVLEILVTILLSAAGVPCFVWICKRCRKSGENTGADSSDNTVSDQGPEQCNSGYECCLFIHEKCYQPMIHTACDLPKQIGRIWAGWRRSPDSRGPSRCGAAMHGL